VVVPFLVTSERSEKKKKKKTQRKKFFFMANQIRFSLDCEKEKKTFYSRHFEKSFLHEYLPVGQ